MEEYLGLGLKTRFTRRTNLGLGLYEHAFTPTATLPCRASGNAHLVYCKKEKEKTSTLSSSKPIPICETLADPGPRATMTCTLNAQPTFTGGAGSLHLIADTLHAFLLPCSSSS